MTSATIIRFPIQRTRPPALSPVALDIYRDMSLRTAGRDVYLAYSVNDGIRASGASRHKVVQARRELQRLGLVTLIESGDGNGPAIWTVSLRQLAQGTFQPDGAA